MLQANFNNSPQRILSIGSFSRQLHIVSGKKDDFKSEAGVRERPRISSKTQHTQSFQAKGIFFLKGFVAGWQEGCYLYVTSQVTQTYISSTVRS